MTWLRLGVPHVSSLLHLLHTLGELAFSQSLAIAVLYGSGLYCLEEQTKGVDPFCQGCCSCGGRTLRVRPLRLRPPGQHPLVTLPVATISGNFALVPSLSPTHSGMQIAEGVVSIQSVYHRHKHWVPSAAYCDLFNIALSPGRTVLQPTPVYLGYSSRGTCPTNINHE